MKKKWLVVSLAMALLAGIATTGFSASIPIDQDFGIIGTEWTLLSFAANDVDYSYTATLTDYGEPTTFDYLYFYVVSSGDKLGGGEATGGDETINFNVDAGRAFTVAILGNTNDVIEAGLFNFRMTGAPVPVPASILLLGSGLFALTALKRKKL